MNLKLKSTPEQIELIKAIGSRDMLVSREAQEAFAAFLGPVIMKVIDHAGTASAFYQDSEYDEDDSPSFPLDLYYNEGAGYVTVWSQNMAGGLPSSEVSGVSEMKIATYRLDSAVSFNKRYARRSRLEIISRAVERMAQEVLIKQERNAWAVVLKALAEGSTTLDSGTALSHLFHSGDGSTTLESLNMDVMNKLMTRMTRIGESFAGGTPAAGSSFGLTDMYVSPETMERLRSLSYQHIGYGGDTEAHSVSRQVDNVPDSVKDDIWRSAGMASIWGVALHELIELGKGHKYNKLMDDSSLMDGGDVKDSAGGNAVASNFTSTHDLAIGIDASKGAFIRALARNADSGSSFTALPDDQWNLNRLDKAGFYGSLEEGRVCIDARAIAGVMLKA
jgi:hypothetical protein